MEEKKKANFIEKIFVKTVWVMIAYLVITVMISLNSFGYVTANHNQSITTNNPAENIGYTCAIINTTYPLVEVHKASTGGGVRSCILNYVGNGGAIGATPHYKDCSVDDPVAMSTFVGNIAYYPNITLNKSSIYCFASDNYGSTYQQKLNSGVVGAPIPDTWVTWIGGGFYTSGATAYVDSAMFIETQELVFNDPPPAPQWLNLSVDIVNNTIINEDIFTFNIIVNSSQNDIRCNISINGNDSLSILSNFTAAYAVNANLSTYTGQINFDIFCYTDTLNAEATAYIIRIPPTPPSAQTTADSINFIGYLLFFIFLWIATIYALTIQQKSSFYFGMIFFNVCGFIIYLAFFGALTPLFAWLSIFGLVANGYNVIELMFP